MAKLDNIYLIGPMGAGKSSIGSRLTKLSKLPFYDSDMEIIKQTGVDIGWIFEMEKETGFRKRETEMLRKLTEMNHIILATGGGTVMTEENRHLLAARGIVIYLKVTLDHQLERTKHQQITRPLLENTNPREVLIELNKKREPLYQSIADKCYITDQTTPIELAKQIWQDVENMRKNDENINC